MSIADDEIDMVAFAAKMDEVVKRLHPDRSKDDWRFYGLLPSTRALYTCYRLLEGEAFYTSDDFVDALTIVTVEIETPDGVLPHARYAPLNASGERWVDLPAMAMNCMGEDSTDEQRAHFEKVVGWAADALEKIGDTRKAQAQGLRTLAQASENGPLAKPMVNHILSEFGFTIGDVVSKGGMLFESERLVDGGNAE